MLLSMNRWEVNVVITGNVQRPDLSLCIKILPFSEGKWLG